MVAFSRHNIYKRRFRPEERFDTTRRRMARIRPYGRDRRDPGVPAGRGAYVAVELPQLGAYDDSRAVSPVYVDCARFAMAFRAGRRRPSGKGRFQAKTLIFFPYN